MTPLIKHATNRGGVRAGAGRRPTPSPAPFAPRPDIARWYVVRTEAGAEQRATLEIGVAGFDLFMPTMWEPARTARRIGGAVIPARAARVMALFPRYVFIRFARSDRWQPVRELPGVECILGTAPDHPIAVPDEAIAAVRAVCSSNGCQYPEGTNMQDIDAPLPIAVGAVARVLQGPLADLSGVCTASDARRVQILMSILGRPVTISLSRAAVEAA